MQDVEESISCEWKGDLRGGIRFGGVPDSWWMECQGELEVPVSEK